MIINVCVPHPYLDVQARPAEGHRQNAYFGTITRRHLLQGPPGTVPEGVEATEPYAAMTPESAPGMSETSAGVAVAYTTPEKPCPALAALRPRTDVVHLAAGALPQPGPVFQALPEPAPLPPLPRPAPQLQAAMPDEASSMAAMTPMGAPAGEASAQYQVNLRHTHKLSHPSLGALPACILITPEVVCSSLCGLAPASAHTAYASAVYQELFMFMPR